MIPALALLLACQAVGELVQRATGVLLPGTIIGFFLLLAWLAIRRRERPELEQVAGWLIGHMSILFVPAFVGLMDQGDLLRRYGVLVSVAAAVSCIATLVVAVTVFQLTARTDAAAP